MEMLFNKFLGTSESLKFLRAENFALKNECDMDNIAIMQLRRRLVSPFFNRYTKNINSY